MGFYVCFAAEYSFTSSVGDPFHGNDQRINIYENPSEIRSALILL